MHNLCSETVARRNEARSNFTLRCGSLCLNLCTHEQHYGTVACWRERLEPFHQGHPLRRPNLDCDRARSGPWLRGQEHSRQNLSTGRADMCLPPLKNKILALFPSQSSKIPLRSATMLHCLMQLCVFFFPL